MCPGYLSGVSASTCLYIVAVPLFQEVVLDFFCFKQLPLEYFILRKTSLDFPHQYLILSVAFLKLFGLVREHPRNPIVFVIVFLVLEHHFLELFDLSLLAANFLVETGEDAVLLLDLEELLVIGLEVLDELGVAAHIIERGHAQF